MPDSAYPIRYHDIDKAQKTDAKQQQKLVSHKDYTLDTFRGDQNHRLIYRNSKICLPKAPQKKTVDWYNDMLCNPVETCIEHTLCRHFDWKGLRTTVHNVCKKCPTCQREKTTNQKYDKLPTKQAETNPWYKLFVDLIGPYTIPRKGKNPLKLWFFAVIDPAIGWLEMAKMPNKTAAEISHITEKTWFTRYPLPPRIVFDRATEFMTEFYKICQNNYGLKRKPITTSNPQSN